MDNDSESPNELWTETLVAIGGDYMLCELCFSPGRKATCRHAVCSKVYGNCSVLWFVQRSHYTRSFGDHQIRLEAFGFG